MVVLESGNMLPSISNQYLQPDYMSSLPTTLDAKKSPLALLAQTCSQIGVDTVTTKPLHSTLEKSKKSPVTENVRSSPTKVHSQDLSLENKSPFRPYEKNMMVKKVDKCQDYIQEKAKTRCSPERETTSPAASLCATPSCESVKNSPEQNSATPSSTRDTSPVIRPASEVLHEYSKDTLLPGATTEAITNTSNAHITSCCSGVEQSNPAFRSSFPGPPFNFQQHTSLFSTGYPNSAAGPYSNYVRVKTPSGGEALVPVCKDIYCTGCQYNAHSQHMLLNSPAACPSGCSQCDHQKYNFAMMPFVPGAIPTSSAYTSLVKPYICNWISGDTYCGKRFVTSEELLQHLRSHTNGIDTNSSSSSVLNPLSLFSSSSLHRPSYLNAINPLSSVRYHPYGKSTLQTLMGPSYSAFGPATFGSYYSPYSFYNQRFGAAAVHP